MGSAALVSFVTGVTEPLEFAFVYVAYPLYAIHAVLTGTSLALVNALGIRDGFGFSAGRHRLRAQLPHRGEAAVLIVIGLGYAVVYYFLFRCVITRWQLRTPGREDDDDAVDDADDRGPAGRTPAVRAGRRDGRPPDDAPRSPPPR